MKWFRDLKIASKFFAVVVVLLALQVFIGVFSIAQLARVNATSTDIEVNWLPSVRVLAQIEVTTAEYRRFELRQHAHARQPVDLDVGAGRVHARKLRDREDADEHLEGQQHHHDGKELRCDFQIPKPFHDQSPGCAPAVSAV